MGSSFHLLDESLTIQAKTDSGHFGNCKTSIHHVTSPSFHSLLEMRKILGCLILGNVLHNLSNVPKVSPFGIKRRRVRGLCTVLFGEVVDNIVMLPCFFGILRGCSNLIIIFGEDIGYRFTGIELCWSFVEEVFHLINKLIVLFDIDSWVFDDEASIFMKCFSHRLAVFCIISRLSEEVCHVNDWDYRLTEEASHV